LLDDGTAGLIAIKKCGGLTVVQDPTDAAYPGMRLSALDNSEVDYCVPIREMGALLSTRVSRRRGKSKSVPADVRTEARIAERVMSDIAEVNGLGTQVPYNCPNCGGVLWKIDADGKRYRCHTGHSFTSSSLLASQSEKIEEMLWISLRMFEERKNLLNSMVKTAAHSLRKNSMRQRAKETQGYIDRIRGMLLAPGPHDANDTLTLVKGLMAGPRKARSTQ
jgi:two-component system, chemotaxis family, protein-glutamate methylesterase/glutaminase